MKITKEMKQVGLVALILLVGGIATSCGSLTKRLEKQEDVANKLGLNFANEKKSFAQQVDATYSIVLPDTVKMNIDGREVTVFNAYKDEEGNTMADFQLQGIIVETKMRSLPERNGKINMDFIITVPKSLIDSRWQLRVYPRAFKTSSERIDLEPLLLSGADFLKRQKDGYEQYKRFVASIIPDSLYWKEMINQKGYNKALADLEQDYYNAWAKDLLTQDQWIDWKDKINKRYNLFNSKMERNRLSIDPEKSLLAILPAYWMERTLDKRTVPATFAEYAWGNKSIVKKTVTAEDSLEIERKFTDLQKIAENERRKQEKESQYNKLVKFPKVAARLDTIVQVKDAFKYHYIQEMDVDGDMKKVKLVLDGDVLAIDLSTYNVPSSDTLTYNVSAMVDFLDEAPRFKKEIVYRQVEKSMKANIEYPVAKADVDEDFSNNRAEFEKVRAMISDIELAEEFVLDSLLMIGYASPEGSSQLNKSLSEKRTRNLMEYVKKNRFFKNNPPIQSRAGGENWSGLYDAVKNGTLFQDERVKSNIMGIANSSMVEDERETKIRQLHPEEYKILKDSVYPALRVTEFRFYTHRANMVQDTIHTTVVDEEYNKGRELLRERKYKEALSILSEYPNDFNLAVAQMSLGYNMQAQDILERIENPNADTLYLLAIIYSRNNQAQKAVNALLHSAELEKKKIFRAQLDPELNLLIEKYDLFHDDLNF